MFVRGTLAAALIAASSLALGAAASGAAPSPAPAARSSAKPAAAPTALPTGAPAPEPAGSAVPQPAASASPRSVGLPFPFSLGATPAPQTYTVFMRGAERQPGLIDIVRKDDDLYFDLGPENFGKTYIVSPSLASGVGSGAFAGRVYDPFLVTFKRVGRRVLWISPNTRYVARKGSPQAQSLAISTADAVLFSTPILAEDADTHHVAIAPSVFLSDFEGIGADLGRSVAPPSLPGLLIIGLRASFGVDASKSYYLKTKAFPKNDEITVNLTFNGPANALPTVPDGRGIPLAVHYSIVSPEHDPKFVPRYADDRIGYFITARKNYDNDARSSPFERFIDRWNLDNGPITFYLTNEIPKQYRDTVRHAILAWNDAFARAGRPGAIVVKDQPSDPSWDPDDVRYSVVRWITSDRPEFAAYSPSVVDEETGQIIRAEVVIDGEAMRAIKRGYIDNVLPAERMRAENDAIAAHPEDLQYTCSFESGGLSQAALGSLLLSERANVTDADRERYAREFLYSTVLHEVGHTLGLRHNFKGSTAFSPAELHDPNFTRIHGTTGSVMAYTPANLAGPGKRQATVFPNHLGPYDYWAIDYGYRRFPGDRTSASQLPDLHRIAARSSNPLLAYGTDEDAVEPYALDPRMLPFNFSSDPIAYNGEQLALNDAVAARLLKPYRGDYRSFEDIRQELVTVLNNEFQQDDLAAHYLGGIYTSRDHRGQIGGLPPFQSIPRAQSKRAFDLLDRYVFSSRALQFSPELLNVATPSRFGFHWDSSGVGRADFPLREVIAEIQDSTISVMFAPANLARIGDQQLKGKPGDTMSLGDLFAWTNAAIFDDLGRSSIPPTHRDLQRRFADLEMRIANLPSFGFDQLGLPREVQSLAREALVKIDRRLPGAIAAARDSDTRAYLDDLRSRVRGTLDPTTVRAL